MNELTKSLHRELHLCIRRYGDQSDVTVYQTLGALALVQSPDVFCGPDGSMEIRREICDIINRYRPKLDIYSILGTVEVVKCDLLEELAEFNKKKKEGDRHATF